MGEQSAMRTRQLLLVFALLGPGCRGLLGQAGQRRLVDAHLHYNGDKGFLLQMLARLEKYDGTAFLLTQLEDLRDV
jgi:hypothetical protein